MKFLIVDTYYPAFLKSVYASVQGLETRPYAVQWRTLMDRCFGTADYYSENLAALGHEATEVIANCRPLQEQWAREHDLALKYTVTSRPYHRLRVPWIQKNWIYPVLRAQIRAFRPDVIHFQDPARTDTAFLHEIRADVRLITGQIASPVPPGTDFSPFDLMLSSLPHFVARFAENGIPSHYFQLGFEPKVLARLQPKQTQYPLVFVGGLSGAHSSRTQLLEEIARCHDISIWGYGLDTVDPKSPLHGCHRGQAWALDMFSILQGAKIALNHHIDIAENNANNMRLYEATGVGTLLLTDYKENLHTIFAPGREVVAYRSHTECVELIDYYLRNETERSQLAQAGQQRTLNEHTYLHRMQEYLEIIADFL